MPNRPNLEIVERWLVDGKPSATRWAKQNNISDGMFRRWLCADETRRFIALWEYEKHLQATAPAHRPYSDFYLPLGAPWQLELDDCVVFADVQIPHTRDEWVDLVCDIGKKHLGTPRTAIIAGDLLNLDAFNGYDPETQLPTLGAEVAAARQFWRSILAVFDQVYWFWGNHEYRATKRTRAEVQPYLLADLVLGKLNDEERIHVSHWGYTFLDTTQDRWIIAHGKNYSVQTLNVAEWLSWKYQRNVISFHEHHLGRGYDRFGNFQLINGGGLFDYEQMGYAQIHASKSPAMVNGFVIFKDGYPYLLGPEGFTRWSDWLD